MMLIIVHRVVNGIYPQVSELLNSIYFKIKGSHSYIIVISKSRQKSFPKSREVTVTKHTFQIKEGGG